ncbi:MAG: tetratricopeptide repeat protein [Chitinophagaceae bacterium]
MSLFKKIFPSKKEDQPAKHGSFSEGDIFFTNHDNQYHLHKLLFFDKNFDCYHVLSYKPTEVLPTVSDIENLEVQVYHSPIDRNGFKNPVFLLNKNITSDDLIGYHEYLRQTQQVSDYVLLVDKYYQDGYRLTNEKKYNEAIDAYSKAIDLVPTFFEAIDNRAFCKMDIGQWEEAIEDFKKSLLVNPGTVLAEFSIGECYFKMKEYSKAREKFEKAHEIDPSDPAPIEFLKRLNDLSGTL